MDVSGGFSFFVRCKMPIFTRPASAVLFIFQPTKTPLMMKEKALPRLVNGVTAQPSSIFTFIKRFAQSEFCQYRRQAKKYQHQETGRKVPDFDLVLWLKMVANSGLMAPEEQEKNN